MNLFSKAKQGDAKKAGVTEQAVHTRFRCANICRFIHWQYRFTSGFHGVKVMKIDAVFRRLFGALMVAACSPALAGPAEPLFTRYARIYTAPILDSTVEWFKDTPMEEARDFDGYRVQFDFTYPLNEVSQLEVILPVYTKGDLNYAGGSYEDDPVPAKLKGYGGTFEFPSIVYERRFDWLERKTGVNVAWQAGFGYVIDPLDVKLRSNNMLVDRFNHAGNKFIFGLKADDEIADGSMTALGNFVLNIYGNTDDLNPSNDGVNFPWLEVNGALVFNGYGKVKPAIEALTSSNLTKYFAFSLSPELLYSAGDSWDIKLGAPFRLTEDGQKYAARLEVSHRF